MPGSVTSSTSSEYTVPSGVTISNFSVSAIFGAIPLIRFGFVDAALHIEVAFRRCIVLAFEDLLEAPYRFGHRDLFALSPAELLRYAERLAQEALNLARAGDRELVLRRKLVDAEN